MLVHTTLTVKDWYCCRSEGLWLTDWLTDFPWNARVLCSIRCLWLPDVWLQCQSGRADVVSSRWHRCGHRESFYCRLRSHVVPHLTLLWQVRCTEKWGWTPLWKLVHPLAALMTCAGSHYAGADPSWRRARAGFTLGSCQCITGPVTNLINLMCTSLDCGRNCVDIKS